MCLHNSGSCGETEAVGHFLIYCTGNVGVARTIKDVCEKLQLSKSINSVVNDMRFVTCVDPSRSPHLCKVGGYCLPAPMVAPPMAGLKRSSCFVRK